MRVDEFWALIDAVLAEAPTSIEQRCSALAARLATLSDDDLVQFQQHFDEAMARAYSWPLWGAAYVMHGGCSDDSFSDFRSSLVSFGSERFESALETPEILAELLPEQLDNLAFEGFAYVAPEELERRGLESARVESPEEPAGEEWDEESVARLYPKIAAASAATPAPQPSPPKTPTAKRSPWFVVRLALFFVIISRLIAMLWPQSPPWAPWLGSAALVVVLALASRVTSRT